MIRNCTSCAVEWKDGADNCWVCGKPGQLGDVKDKDGHSLNWINAHVVCWERITDTEDCLV